MTNIPLPMSHEELLNDYLKTKERLDRLVKLFDQHFHIVETVSQTCETSKCKFPSDFRLD